MLWGDHGWHLGEHAIWGKHSLFEEALRSPLIIYQPEMKNGGKTTQAIVETNDIFPTLCDLTGMKIPEFTNGQSLLPLLKDPKSAGHTAIGYNGKGKTIRTATHRLTLHKNGAVELYDHTSVEKETKNIAPDHPELVAELTALLQIRMKK